MNEPERNEDTAPDGDIAAAQTTPGEQLLIEPKAYAYDGWSMVPFEPESA